MDTLETTFLAQGRQTADDVLARLLAFVAEARRSLDIAIYDVRLSDRLLHALRAALAERMAAGVQVRLAYDGDKPDEPDLARGQDPAPPGSGDFVRRLGVSWCRVAGFKLMHHKYIVRDAGTPDAAVWTGSANLTDDSWQLQENNVLVIHSPEIAGHYARNFVDLWEDANFEGSGDFDTEAVRLRYDGEPAWVQVLFSPGRGELIDEMVARRIRDARRRIWICSMLMNSSSLIAALTDVLDRGHVPIRGLYDRTQQEGVFRDWQHVAHNQWKIPAIRAIANETRLAGKNSLPYAPDTPHDFMHNKVLVVDDTVITGSYNFSRSAMQNAENILFIDSPALAAAYTRYIDELVERYQPATVPL